MKKILATTLLLTFATVPGLADTPETGVVSGRILDPGGQTLPGVTVTLEGSRGEKSVRTGPEGRYRFALLAPGSYAVKASLEGFKTAEGVAAVTAGSKIEIDLTMVLETEEAIVVTSEAPLIDRYEVTAGATLTTDVGQRVTTANASYYDIVAVLPGVSQDGDLSSAYPSVNGSRWMESSVFIDGVDTTYARRGGSRIYLPDVATTEVSLQAGGSSAEYGRAVGSTTSVITKSGTNTFHGELQAIRQEGDWVSEYELHPELEVRQSCQDRILNDPAEAAAAASCFEDFFVRDPLEKEDNDTTLQAGLGGPIVRDKAWFFASWAEINTFSSRQTFSGDIIDNSSFVDSRVAKLNFQPKDRHSFAVSWVETPVDIVFVLGDFPADRYGVTPHRLGGELINGTWNYSISSNLFMESKIALHESTEHKSLTAGTGFDLESATLEKQQDPRYPAQPELGPHNPGNNFSGYIDSFGESHLWNGWALDNGFGLNTYPRDQANMRLTWFANELHDFMFGIDYQDVAWDQDLQRNDTYNGPVFSAFTDSGFESCSLIGGDICVFQNYQAPVGLEGTPPGTGTESSNWAFFARDRFSVGPHWAFNIGLRAEKQEHRNDVGRAVIDSTEVAPRIQVAYDIAGDGKKLVSVNLGRSYQHIPQEQTNDFLLETWNGTNAFDRLLYCSLIDTFFIPGCGGAFNVGYNLLQGVLRPGTMWQQVDAGIFSVDIEPYYKDEIVLGFEWNFSGNWLFDAKAIYYELGNSIGNTIQRLPNGDFFTLSENYKDYPEVLGALGVVDRQILDNFEEGSREYQSIQLQLNRRMADNWAFYNNVTIQESEGHFAGGLFDNTSADYGRNLDTVLNQAHIDRCTEVQMGNSNPSEGRLSVGRTFPVDCEANLSPLLGQPLSTINRFGTLSENHSVVFKSFGFYNWQLGDSKHALSLGGFFQWESGKPWQRTETLGIPVNCSDPTTLSCDPSQNVVDNDLSVYIEPRGSRSPFNSVYELDLFGTWSFPLGGRVNGELRVEASNITDQQRLQRISSRGEVSSSRAIGWQSPRRFRGTVTIRF